MFKKPQNPNDFSSQPHVELQEYDIKSEGVSEDKTAPLDQSQQQLINSLDQPSFFRSLAKKPKFLFFCFGFVVFCLLAILLLLNYFILSPEIVPGYKVSDYYQDDFQYSVLLKPTLPTIQLSLRDVDTTLDLLPNLNLTIKCYSPSHFRVMIKDADNERWEIPDEYPYPYVENPMPCNYRESDLEFSIKENPFSLKITRKSTGESILDTRDSPLVFSKYYIELTNYLSSFDFFGLGQRLYKLQMGPGNYTIWPKDIAGDLETGESGHNNYGQHPIYLLREPSGNYHIVLLRNSNAMEIQLRNDKSLKYQVVGGILDLNIFVGSKDPETVVEKYHEYLGKWTIPPFWSMGYHQSRWGYSDLEELKYALQGYKDNKIPLDAIWSDIDYMTNYLDFTIDTDRFPLEEFKAVLKDFDKKWIPIIDAGIGTSKTAKNVAYHKGLEQDLFLKNKDGKNLLAKVWPSEAVFPDFLNPATEDYWVEMLGILDQEMPFDGIWLDMNEVSNFCDGECNKPSKNVYSDLPFLPGGTDLQIKTASLDAVHYGGVQEFDVHSLFNLLEQKATYKYLKTKNPLPFILTRANIFGTGKFASHWLGDTNSDWTSMKRTISSLITYNLFGIPHVGADICGFSNNTTPELCTRWTQLGAFYPFARNHHEMQSNPQEPFRFEQQYMKPMIDAIKFRYSILKHYYTLFVSKNGTGTIVKPLYFEFPDDQSLFRFGDMTEVRYIEEQFMLGKSIMVTAVLDPDTDETEAYFPEGAWYNLETFESVRLEKDRTSIVSSETLTPAFVRGGWVIMMQNSSEVNSSRDLGNEFSMVVALPEEKSSKVSEVLNMRSLASVGEILDIDSYDENTVYEQCVQEDCVLNLSVEFEWDITKSQIKLAIQAKRRNGSAKKSEGVIMINEIKVLGDGIRDFDVSLWDKLKITKNEDVKNQQSTDKIQHLKDSLVIKMESRILLENGSKVIIENLD